MPPCLLSWISFVSHPLSFLDRGSCGIPTPSGLGVAICCSDCGLPPAQSLLLFSELRYSVATGLWTGSPSRGCHLRARTCLVNAAWVGSLKSSVTHRDGSESDSLDPPDTAARVVPCLFPSCQVLVRRSEDRLSRLQHGGLAVAVPVPGLPPRGSGSLHQSPMSSPSGVHSQSAGPEDRRG